MTFGLCVKTIITYSLLERCLMIFTFPGLSADLPFDMFVDLETFIGTLGAVGVFNHDFTKAPAEGLLPWYVTGLVDAEGHFQVGFHTKNNGSVSEVKVTQKAESAGVLHGLVAFFGVGSVVWDNRKDNTLKWHCTNRAALLNCVLPHFEAYPLLTSKALNLAS